MKYELWHDITKRLSDEGLSDEESKAEKEGVAKICVKNKIEIDGNRTIRDDGTTVIAYSISGNEEDILTAKREIGNLYDSWGIILSHDKKKGEEPLK